MSNTLRAMVLAAGIGSRLHPLSSMVPKPLIQVAGKPIMEHILLQLKKNGFHSVISNTHHLGDQIQDYFKDAKERLDIDLQFIHEETLSGVAGGIRRCAHFLKEGTACIVMGDALTDIDLGALHAKHKEAVEKNNCLATVAMMKVEDTTQFGVIVTQNMIDGTSNDETGSRIVKFQEKPKAEEALSSWANTGVYFFEPEIYNFIPTEEEAPKYDVAKDLFPKLLEAGEYIQSIEVAQNSYWADLGTPKQYLQSVKDIKDGLLNLEGLVQISPTAQVSPEAKLEGVNEISSNSKIAANVSIKNCVIWDNVTISEGAQLENCIISSGTVIEANVKHSDEILVAQAVA